MLVCKMIQVEWVGENRSKSTIPVDLVRAQLLYGVAMERDR